MFVLRRGDRRERGEIREAVVHQKRSYRRASNATLPAMFQNSSHIRVDNSNLTNVQGDLYNIHNNTAGCGQRPCERPQLS